MRIGANGQLQVSASSIHLRLPTTWTSSSNGKYLIYDLKSTSQVLSDKASSGVQFKNCQFQKKYVIFLDMAIFSVSVSIGFDEEVKGRGAAAEDIKVLEFDFQTVKL